MTRLAVRGPIAGEILAVNIRPGEFGQAGEPRAAAPNPISTNAIVSPRGAAKRLVAARFVRAGSLAVPNCSLTNSAAERVDMRVMQII